MPTNEYLERIEELEAQRDTLVEAMRELRGRVSASLLEVRAEALGLAGRNYAYRQGNVESYDEVLGLLDAILAAHASPAETPAQGGEHDDKEGNPL